MKETRAAFEAFLDSKKYGEAFGCLKLLWSERDYRSVERFREALRNAKLTKKVLDLYRMSYDLTARDMFDDFMLALEWNRPREQQFWLPRRSKLLSVCNALQDLADDKLDELFLNMPPRVGKALADDTPILTRNGWKNHGDLVVGDEVLGMDGSFKKVLAVHPKCMVDREIRFTNGEVIQCHANHEWLVYDRTSGSEKTLETNALEKRKIEYGGKKGTRGHRYVLQIPKKNYVIGEQKELPLDPYTLGVWLGDGTNKNPTIANAEEDRVIIDTIEKNGYPVRWSSKNEVTGVWAFGFGFRKELQSMGMCHSRRTTDKHIPEEYLTADIEQRLELLAGLLDTDGSLVREEKRYQFSTCDVPLMKSFLELVATFGWRCSVKKTEPCTSSSGVVGRRPTYTVAFNPDCYIPCKVERKQLREFSKQRKVAIESISVVEPKQGNCITVEDGLYLCGRNMIPTHNSSIVMFFLIWWILRNPEAANLYSSYSDTVTDVFYNGVKEVMEDPTTYRWQSIFPERRLVSTDSKNHLLNVDREKRYASFTARSLYGTLNGACDCSPDGLEIADDLHSGIEEALNKARLDSAWNRVDNNFLPRAKPRTKNLWIGTRWSLYDCVGRRLDLLENDPKYGERRYLVLNMPALNENGESNFEYDFGVGFDTRYYEMRKASFIRSDDLASWEAQYQNHPVERTGTVFLPESLRYYNGVLPEDEPDSWVMFVDPAWGGGDYVAGAVIARYDNDLYLHDVVFNNGDKKITQPEVASKAAKWGCTSMHIEGTRVTSSYAEGVQKIFDDKGYKLNLTTTTKHWSGSNGKAQRIFDLSPDIKDHVIFRDEQNRSGEYQRFMENLFGFKIEGKTKHDDAPDVLAIAITIIFNAVMTTATLHKRPF